MNRYEWREWKWMYYRHAWQFSGIESKHCLFRSQFSRAGMRWRETSIFILSHGFLALLCTLIGICCNFGYTSMWETVRFNVWEFDVLEGPNIFKYWLSSLHHIHFSQSDHFRIRAFRKRKVYLCSRIFSAFIWTCKHMKCRITRMQTSHALNLPT